MRCSSRRETTVAHSTALQQAGNSWRDLDVPYEAARTRVLVGLARRKLGDDESAELEFDAARRAFTELGALPDLTRLEKLSGHTGTRQAAGLTGREVEVLALVRDRKDQPANRHRPGDKREDRRSPHQQHVHEVAAVFTCCRHRLRLRARSRLARLHRIAHLVSLNLGASPEEPLRFSLRSVERYRWKQTRGGPRSWLNRAKPKASTRS